jgi:hypothetical protein
MRTWGCSWFALVGWNARGGRRAGSVLWLTEVLQSLLPYRSGDPMDLAAGAAGAVVGAVLGAQTGAATD